MKKLMIAILVLAMLPFSIASGASYTLTEKMQRQLQIGSGLKGSFAIHANADVTRMPFLAAIQNAEYQIRGILNGEDLHYLVYQENEKEEQHALTEISRIGGSYFFRSDFLPEGAYTLPAAEKMLDTLSGARGENPSVSSVVLHFLTMSAEEKKEWAPVTEQIEKGIEQWVSGFSAETTYERVEGQATRLTLAYSIPVSGLQKFIPELIRQIAGNEECMRLLRKTMTEDMIQLYLNPQYDYFYEETLRSLDLLSELKYTKIISTMGETIGTTLSMPLDQGKIGYHTLSVTQNPDSVIYMLTGDTGCRGLMMPVEKETEENEWTKEYGIVSVTFGQDSDNNMAWRIRVEKTHTESEDPDGPRKHETDHYVVRAEQDVSLLPEEVKDAGLPERKAIEAEADLHFSSKPELSSPTTLEFDGQVRQGAYDLTVTGKVKSASPWEFVPFRTEGAKVIDPLNGQELQDVLLQWITNAMAQIERLPGESNSQE